MDNDLEAEIDRLYSPGDVTGRNDFRAGAEWQRARRKPGEVPVEEREPLPHEYTDWETYGD